MNPKDPSGPPQIIDDIRIPGVDDSGKGKTYAVVTVLNDGTRTTEYRRYSGKGTENDPVVKTISDVDPKQEDRWKEQQRLTTPTATSQATAGRQGQDKRLGVHPETGRPAWVITNYDGTVEYDENVPASVTGGVAAVAKGRKGTVENGEWVVREIEADGSQGRIIEQRPATQAEKDQAAGVVAPGTQDAAELLRQKQENQKNGKGYKTDAEVERDTQATTKETETKRNTWKPVGRETVKNEQTGVTEEVTMEENLLGERRPVTNKSTTIAKPEANPPIGRLPEGTHLGNITRGVMESAREIHDDPSLSPQDKIKAYDLLEKYGSLLANEEEAILRSQQNTLSNQTSQRNTDIQEAASRRTFSANLMDNAFKNTATKVADPSTVAPAFMAQIELGIHLAQKLGGLNTYDRVQPGAASQQVMGMGLGGQQQQPMQSAPGGQQAAAPGGGITINNISPQPQQVPAAVEQNMPASPVQPATPPMHRDSWEPVPPEEAQIPEWMRQQQYA